MTIPAIYPLSWVRGTTTPLVFAMRRNGVPLPFDDVRLSVYKKNGSIIWRATYSDGGGITVVNPATGLLKFQPTPEQTRQLIQSKTADSEAKNIYELEYWYQGSQEVYLMGDVLAIGGINDDEADPS